MTDHPRPRIVSLVPAATDIVVALGHADRLVGVSHECDHPAAADLPVVTSASVPAAGLDASVDPADVDRAVTSTLAAGDALYRTDLDLLASLDPDVVIGQGICDVCAVDASSLVGHLPADATLLTLAATSLDDLADDVAAVAEALGDPGAGVLLLDELGDRLATVAMARPVEVPTVVTLEWGDPPFVGGHWVPELVAIAGGRDVLGRPDRPSRRATWDEIIAADPDIVLYLPCGYLLDVAVREAERLAASTPLGAIADRVVVADAGRLFSRCTPVVADAAEGLGAILAGREAIGFVRLRG